MNCYIVNFLDTQTGERVSLPAFKPWTKLEVKHFTEGPLSRDNGRAYLFSLAQGLPENVALRIGNQSYKGWGKGRFVIESVQFKGENVYSELDTGALAAQN